MITSSQILKLYEDWEKTISYGNKPINIFVNPTSSDLIKLTKSISDSPKEVRFIADAKTQKVYVWDASLAIHNNVRPQLGFSHEILDTSNIIDGTVGLSNGKLNMIEDNLNDIPILINLLKQKSVSDSKLVSIKNYLIKIFETKWNWVGKYIFGFEDYISRQRDNYKKLKI